MNFHDLVLSTLSFYEPMNLGRIIFDMDQKLLESHPEFDQDLLDKILGELVAQKQVKLLMISGEKHWQRIFKKRPFLERVERYLRQKFNL